MAERSPNVERIRRHLVERTRYWPYKYHQHNGKPKGKVYRVATFEPLLLMYDLELTEWPFECDLVPHIRGHLIVPPSLEEFDAWVAERDKK